MATVGIYFSDEEAEVVRARPKGWARSVVLAALDEPDSGAEGERFTVVIDGDDLISYVRKKGGAKWLAKVAEVNLALSKSVYGEQMGWGWECEACHHHNFSTDEVCAGCGVVR